MLEKSERFLIEEEERKLRANRKRK